MWEVWDTSPETTNMVYAYPGLCQLVVLNELILAYPDSKMVFKLTIGLFDMYMANRLEPEIVAGRLDPPPKVAFVRVESQKTCHCVLYHPFLFLALCSTPFKNQHESTYVFQVCSKKQGG